MTAVRAIFMAKNSFTKIQISYKYNKNKTNINKKSYYTIFFF